jgi:hypothetical protein
MGRNPSHFYAWCPTCAEYCAAKAGLNSNSARNIAETYGIFCTTIEYMKAATPNGPFIKSNKRKEKSCQSCQRMNDVGVKVCWCCGGLQ